METVALKDLVKLCIQGNEQAKQELWRRWEFDWDAFIKGIEDRVCVEGKVS